MPRLVRRLAVAVLVTAAAGVVVPLAGPAAPASAATCSSTGGVTVVVDYRELGGGVQGTCVRDGAGKRASALFPAAGIPLNTSTPDNPGYVCQVAGKPAGCTPPDDNAYWGLWWSTGAGTWTYSSYGVSGLKVPDGAWVGFSWKQGAGEAPAPGVTPRTPSAPPPSPTPTQQPTAPPSPTQQPTRTPSGAPSPAQTQEPDEPPASATPSATKSPTGTPSPTSPTSTAPTPSPTTPAAPTSSAAPAEAPSLAEPSAPVDGADTEATSADSAGTLPWWVPVLVIVLLFAAVGAAWLAKRRQTRA